MNRGRNSNLALFFISVLSCALCAGAGMQDKGANEKLLSAIREADARTARSLLSRGADASAKDNDGLTALMYAAMYARADCVELLLVKGAAPNARNNDGLTALMLAAGDFDKAKLLLARGANVNAKGGFGITPLIIAAGNAGAIRVVNLLLDQGADWFIDKDFRHF